MKKLILVLAMVAASVFAATPTFAEDVPDPVLTETTAPTDTPPEPPADPPADTPAETPADIPADTATPGAGDAKSTSGLTTAKMTKVTADDAPTVAFSKKVFVCKYITKPGGGEILQTGDNPISVSINSIIHKFTGNPELLVGLQFADAQGRSVVIAVDNGQAEPTVEECASFVSNKVQAEEPTTTPATCKHDGRLVLPTTDGVVYTVDPAYDGPGTYTVTATAAEGFTLIGESEFTVTVDAQLSDDECATPKGDEPDEPDGILPNTGGAPLWMLLLGVAMAAGGVTVLRRTQPVPTIPPHRLKF